MQHEVTQKSFEFTIKCGGCFLGLDRLWSNSLGRYSSELGNQMPANKLKD